jgi:hypothetical protein
LAGFIAFIAALIAVGSALDGAWRRFSISIVAFAIFAILSSQSPMKFIREDDGCERHGQFATNC